VLDPIIFNQSPIVPIADPVRGHTEMPRVTWREIITDWKQVTSELSLRRHALPWQPRNADHKTGADCTVTRYRQVCGPVHGARHFSFHSTSSHTLHHLSLYVLSVDRFRGRCKRKARAHLSCREKTRRWSIGRLHAGTQHWLTMM